MAAYSPIGLRWLRMQSKAAGSRHADQSLLDWHALKLCGSFTLQVTSLVRTWLTWVPSAAIP